MKRLVFALALAAATPACAHPSWNTRHEFQDYLRHAKAAALRKTDGLEVGDGVAVNLRVGGDGRLYGAQIVQSSGSPELDRRIARAVRFLRVEDPPTLLVAGAVTLRFAPQRVAQIEIR